jgi:hypothetical protein
MKQHYAMDRAFSMGCNPTGLLPCSTTNNEINFAITSSPGASGMVLDAQTHAAISGAQVVVSRSWPRERPDYSPSTLANALTNTRPPLIITGTNGRFSIPRQHEWILYVPAPELAPAVGTGLRTK